MVVVSGFFFVVVLWCVCISYTRLVMSEKRELGLGLDVFSTKMECSGLLDEGEGNEESSVE